MHIVNLGWIAVDTDDQVSSKQYSSFVFYYAHLLVLSRIGSSFDFVFKIIIEIQFMRSKIRPNDRIGG